MPGWFELKRSKSNDHYFVLRASNGEIILTSEMYKSKASAGKGIASVQKNSQSDKRFRRVASSKGRHHFNLTAGNHQVIGTSESYKTEQACETGVASVKHNGKTKVVKDNA